jgi:predicted MPP superfamily phosphohydrolase
MSHSFDALPEDDPLTKSFFHHVLVGFGAPAAWPVWTIYLIAGTIAAGLGWWWAARGAQFIIATLVGLIQLSFFLIDRALLASLPRRRVSFGSWKAQFFALALPRAAVALALGLLIPWAGWGAPFFVNLVLQFIGTLALYRGAILEPARLSLTELNIPTDRLPAGRPGFRILHVSDLHIERLGDREEKLLELARASAPDVILITGDFVNLSFNVDPVTHAQVRDYLGRLCAPLGVYAVTGSPPVDLPGVIPPLFEGLPVRLLRDEAVEVEGPGGCLTVIGVECHHDIARDAANLDSVLAATPGDGPRVLLYHSPELMPQAVERGIDLYLCGHTHGGQVRLPIVGPVLTSSKLGRRYVMGHYHEGRTHLYVSRGVGFEGLGAPRVRLFCLPEITLITLEGAERRGAEEQGRMTADH